MRKMSPVAGAYLDFVLKGTGAFRHKLVRELHALSRRWTPRLFCQVVDRALKYKVSNLRELSDIARLLVRDDTAFVPQIDFDPQVESREEFKEGRFTDPPDLTSYDKLLEGNDEKRNEGEDPKVENSRS